jgi:hypothetical protein
MDSIENGQLPGAVVNAARRALEELNQLVEQEVDVVRSARETGEVRTALEAGQRASANVRAVRKGLAAVQSELGEEFPADANHDSLIAIGKMSDGLACFNHLYKVVTAEILGRLETSGLFIDPTFLAMLDMQFAKRYFEAIVATDPANSAKSSCAWDVLFERRGDTKISKLQFAIAGVNTHINYDLPFAVVETCHALDRNLHVPGHRHDYDRVNEIFFAKIPTLRHRLEERWEKDLDRRLFRTVNNWVDDVVLALDRTTAWYHAEYLWRLHDDHRSKAEADLDEGVAGLNRVILHEAPGWVTRNWATKRIHARALHGATSVAGTYALHAAPAQRAVSQARANRRRKRYGATSSG